MLFFPVSLRTLINTFRTNIAGKREADINVAEGKKRARILNSEAFMAEQVNQAKGNVTL